MDLTKEVIKVPYDEQRMKKGAKRPKKTGVHPLIEARDY